MKYEDYEAIVQKLTPENAPEIITSMLSAVKEDLTERDALAKCVEEQGVKISDLQNTNTKLVLSLTGKADMDKEEVTEEEKIEAMDLNEYLNYIKESEEK